MSDSSFAFQCTSFPEHTPVTPKRSGRAPVSAQPELEAALTAYTTACKSWLPRLRRVAPQSEGVVGAVAEVALGALEASPALTAAHRAVAEALVGALERQTDRGFMTALAQGLAAARETLAAALEASPGALRHADHEGYRERIGSILLAFAYQVESVGRWRRYGSLPLAGRANTLEVDDLVEVDDGGPRLVRVCFITSEDGHTRALFAGFVDPRWATTARARALALHEGGLAMMVPRAIDHYPKAR